MANNLLQVQQQQLSDINVNFNLFGKYFSQHFVAGIEL